ncbi:MAG: hypothetical protein V2I33_21990, partial [Kangiellaceae bacterium]|nr:hypothetical protein [Kangiellaceae bacterium]
MPRRTSLAAVYVGVFRAAPTPGVARVVAGRLTADVELVPVALGREVAGRLTDDAVGFGLVPAVVGRAAAVGLRTFDTGA